MTRRVPRPEGLTQLNRKIQKKEEHPNKFLSHIVSHYIQNSCTLNKQACTIDQLAQYTNTSKQACLKEFFRQVKRTTGLINPDRIGEAVAFLSLNALNWALEDRLQAQNQVGLLLNAQGVGYKPFISSEVTNALKHSASTTANMAAIIKTLPGQPNLNSKVPNHSKAQEGPIQVGNLSPEAQPLSLEAAYTIINEQPRLLSDSVSSPLLEEDLPDVVANITGEVTIDSALYHSKQE